jgi:hypothetical protein
MLKVLLPAGCRFLVSLVALLLLLTAVPAHAQGRMSDKDLEHMLENLKNDAHSFRPDFQNALKHTAVRKTSRESDDRQIAADFERQTNELYKQFKSGKKIDGFVPSMLSKAQQLDRLVYELQLDPGLVSQWERIKGEVHQVAAAYNLDDHFASPSPVAGNAAASSSQPAIACSTAVGAERSARLVEECTKVSPATHPPCNAQNSCVLIIDEIKRGCSLLGRDAPQFCLEYK